MIELYEATVFGDDEGNFGDKHGIIIDEKRAIDPARRLAIAAKLGYAETIFINDIAKSDISFFAQTEEIPFAGTAALAVTGMLRNLTDKNPIKLTSHGNAITVEVDDKTIWVEAALAIMPPWHHIELASATEVENISPGEAKDFEHTMVWAWIDKDAGTIRARTFAADWLLPETEANGSGSMMLAATLNRRIAVLHGKGSRILAEPKPNNMARLGGHVTVNESPIKTLDL